MITGQRNDRLGVSRVVNSLRPSWRLAGLTLLLSATAIAIVVIIIATTLAAPNVDLDQCANGSPKRVALDCD